VYFFRTIRRSIVHSCSIYGNLIFKFGGLSFLRGNTNNRTAKPVTFPIETVREDSILKGMALGYSRNVGMAVLVESNTNLKKGNNKVLGNATCDQE
jgi:hypothetical protein